MTSMISPRVHSRSTTAPPRSSARWATLCAETLTGIADPLFPALAAALSAPPATAARVALSGLVEPLDSPALTERLPNWLLPHQAEAVARARAVLGRFGGVLIADGVGLGKTFIALALAALELRAGGDAVAVVPAALREEWADAGRRVEVPVRTISHTELARRVPQLRARCTLVLVDEAHAFRNARTRRYDALARLCVGRRVALLTATPLNNARADLAALVQLFAGRDRFREFGVADFGAELAAPDPGPAALALGAISVCRTRRLVEERFPALRSAFPRRRLLPAERFDLDAVYGGALAGILVELERLGAGDEATEPGRALMRLGLLRRLESSRAAFLCSLRRHRDVLDEVARAHADGVAIGRREVRALAEHWGDDVGQLALWPLLEPPGSTLRASGTVGWRAVIDRVLALAGATEHASDPKLAALDALLAGTLAGRKTIVFTEYRDTALALLRHLRRRHRVLAVLGDAAWAGTGRITRREALDAFAPLARARPPAKLLDAEVLVATDVAGEGLNLQDACAVVNYDLPWNPVRVMQRVGRIDRLYSPHEEILVAHLLPAAGLHALTGVLERLRHKLAGAPRLPGAEPDPLAALWWTARGVPSPEAVEAESWRRVEAFEARERWRAWIGAAPARSPQPLVAAGLTEDGGPREAGLVLALQWADGRRIPLAYHCLADAPPRFDPEAVGRLAGRALTARPLPSSPTDFGLLLAAALPDARHRLIEHSAARRGGAAAGPGRAAALELLARFAAAATLKRSDSSAVERATAALARDLPVGLDRLLARLVAAASAPEQLARRIAELVETAAPPSGPQLNGTPRLVLVAALVLASACPEDP
jgi:hypothetical protein